MDDLQKRMPSTVRVLYAYMGHDPIVDKYLLSGFMPAACACYYDLFSLSNFRFLIKPLVH